MDAIVEVATAGVTADATTVTAKAVRVFVFVRNALSRAVATFTMPVPSMGSHSISAVAPNTHFNDWRLAKAA